MRCSKINTQKHYEQEATEKEFLDWYKTENHKEYEKPSLTIDNVTLSIDDEGNLSILLIKRKAHPFKDCWALPGGFVSGDENTDTTCLRETEEETGVKLTTDDIEQLYTFSEPGRDPRAWIVSVAYLSFLPEQIELVANDDAKDAIWATIKKDKDGKIIIGLDNDVIIIGEENKPTKLAFDHAEIIKTALKRLAGKLDYDPQVIRVLGPTFTLTEVRNLFKQIDPLKSLDSNSNLLRTHGHFFEATGNTKHTSRRPAKEYRRKS